jgi:tetratricopeptide (TPR) repeat protein
MARRRLAFGVAGALLLAQAAAGRAQQPPDAAAEARRLATVGRYDDAARGLTTYLATHPQATVWETLGEVLLARGRLDSARAAFTRALADGTEDSVVATLHLAELAERRGERVAARRRYRSFIPFYNTGPRRSSRELAAVARAAWHLGAEDPELFKDALRAYDEAIAADSANLEARVAEGNLFLEKYNGTDAGASFEAVLRADPRHPGALLGLAQTAYFDGDPEALPRVKQALAVNPHFVPALLFLARLDLESEAYAQAADDINRALAVDPSSLQGIALLAATKYLTGDSSGFAAATRQALAADPQDAALYTTLADVAARNRRYAEAATFARRAIALDSSSWRGYAVLGMNDLRLGRMAEGRKELETAFRGDPYDVWTKNTLDLLDNLDRYRTVVTTHFRLVTAPDETALLALYAGPLAEQAFDSLAQRYGYRPPTPIRVEMYDRHADFSVRTVGLAGFDALGVSFGPVVVMDAPSAREPGHFHWGSTLWHEISHSFHLGLSGSRVPRWFTEGLAVFEEHRARPGWGDGVTPEFLLAFLEHRLLPVSQLSRGFLSPEYPEQLIYSYYEASLVCDDIVALRGLGALRALLEQFGQGRTVEQAFQVVLGTPLATFDAQFNDYLRQRFAGPLAALTPWTEGAAKTAQADPAALLERARANPGDFEAHLLAGHALFERGDLKAAEPLLARARQLFPGYAGPESAGWYLAQIYQRRGERARAAAELDSLTQQNAGDYRALLALAALRDSLGEKAAAARALNAALFVYPLDVPVHLHLAQLAAELEDWPTAIRERRAVVALAPVDSAEAMYELALAYFQGGKLDEAHDTVLRALEQAPSFEKAQELLLKVRAAMHHG